MAEDGHLGSAFGDKGTKANQIAYGHPYADSIIESAIETLEESETGRIMLSLHLKKGVPIHVIKGNGEIGYNPEAKIIYIQAPAKETVASPKTLLLLIKALREADQEMIGFTAPDPMKDIMEYAAIMHSKNIDSIVHVCKVVKELTNSSHFPVLLDAIREIGYSDVYQAVEKDASKDEIFDAYEGSATAH